MIRRPPESTLFPSRRSSNLVLRVRHKARLRPARQRHRLDAEHVERHLVIEIPGARQQDRKSTRLNSSHANISYAVFCLKKKNHSVQTVLSITHLTCFSLSPP